MTDIERIEGVEANEKIENEASATENGAENKECDREERMFTQSQLEEIIAERLSRERRVNESLSSVKTLLKSAAERGILKGNSYAEMARELVERLTASSPDETDKEKASADKAEESTVCGITAVTGGTEAHSADADAEESNAEKSGGNSNGSKNESEGEGNNEGFTALLCDIKARYPRETVEKLFSTDLFERFAKGRSGSTREIIDDFFSFVSSVGTGVTEEGKESEQLYPSLASTAFSSNAGTHGAVTNLTKQQMDIAKSAGMSYREYANLLESVPKRAARTI